VAGIELAVLGSSNWATLLDPDDLMLLEYAADLKVCLHVYRDAYIGLYSAIDRFAP